jgi:hypothetical protein
LGESEYASDKQKHIHHNPMFHLTIYKPLIQAGSFPAYLLKKETPVYQSLPLKNIHISIATNSL